MGCSTITKLRLAKQFRSSLKHSKYPLSSMKTAKKTGQKRCRTPLVPPWRQGTISEMSLWKGNLINVTVPAFAYNPNIIVNNKTFKKRIDLLKALFDTISCSCHPYQIPQ